MKKLGNLTGAFADGAILFPLLAALALKTGMDGAVLMASAGIAYIAAGFLFRVPMAVQPLKSVVVAALAMGASAGDIRFSGLCIGIVCLLLSLPLFRADKIADLVPRHIVHGLQAGLGILLMLNGGKWGLGKFGDPFVIGGFIALTAMIVFLSLRFDKPVMGWVATAGLVVAVVSAFFQEKTALPAPDTALHFNIIAALVLPQLALTLTNSVIGTQDVAQRYFGEAASRVSVPNLLRSIGLGNILFSPLGGLPFCHGAGGVTAHYKGGAKTEIMNFIIGGALLALAAVSWMIGVPLIPAYPKILMAALLFVTGWFHVQLAMPSWAQKELRFILIAMAVAALATQNMLWVMAVGVVGELFRLYFDRKQGQTT